MMYASTITALTELIALRSIKDALSRVKAQALTLVLIQHKTTPTTLILHCVKKAVHLLCRAGEENRIICILQVPERRRNMKYS